jgi:hypothetical protein
LIVRKIGMINIKDENDSKKLNLINLLNLRSINSNLGRNENFNNEILKRFIVSVRLIFTVSS